MKVNIAIKEAVMFLKNSMIASYNLDAKILMTHVLNVNSQDLILKYQDSLLTSQNYQKYLDLIKLRVNRVPISHLINRREFYNNEFFVNENVLDPRPDSEALIEMMHKKYSSDSLINLCEIGCGSGCLIITLLKIFKNWNGVAIDISNDAIDVAKKNAKTHDVFDKINFVNSNIFANIPDKTFDIIISNPPYIPTNDIDNLQDEVRLYEPKIALDGGLDGLNFYRQISQQSKNYLNKSGKIFVEIGFNQFNDVKNIFLQNNYILTDFNRDINNIIRAVEFTNNN